MGFVGGGGGVPSPHSSTPRLVGDGADSGVVTPVISMSAIKIERTISVMVVPLGSGEHTAQGHHTKSVIKSEHIEQ